MYVLKIALRYLLIAEIIEMAQPAPMVNLPPSPLLINGHIKCFEFSCRAGLDVCTIYIFNAIQNDLLNQCMLFLLFIISTIYLLK